MAPLDGQWWHQGLALGPLQCLVDWMFAGGVLAGWRRRQHLNIQLCRNIESILVVEREEPDQHDMSLTYMY